MSAVAAAIDGRFRSGARPAVHCPRAGGSGCATSPPT